MPEPDWLASGLLDGLDAGEREDRLELLRHLHAQGVEVAQLVEAAQADRLALLPVELVLSRGQEHSLRDCARETGLSLEQLERNHRALGLARVDPDTPVYDDDQLENLRMLKAMVDAGIPFETLLELGRILGHGAARTTMAMLERIGGGLMQPGDSEQAVGLRYAAFAEATLPSLGRMLAGPIRLHLAETVRRNAINRTEREAGALSGARVVSVAFADLSGFTSLSDTVAPQELGDLAGRFESLVAEAVAPPVRLVKVLGDGAMLVCETPGPLLDLLFELVDAVPASGLPPLHAGIAHGPALANAGDWFGRTVNVAARLSGVAGPGEIVATPEVREGAGDAAAAWGEPESVHLKGLAEAVAVLRVWQA